MTETSNTIPPSTASVEQVKLEKIRRLVRTFEGCRVAQDENNGCKNCCSLVSKLQTILQKPVKQPNEFKTPEDVIEEEDNYDHGANTNDEDRPVLEDVSNSNLRRSKRLSNSAKKASSALNNKVQGKRKNDDTPQSDQAVVVEVEEKQRKPKKKSSRRRRSIATEQFLDRTNFNTSENDDSSVHQYQEVTAGIADILDAPKQEIKEEEGLSAVAGSTASDTSENIEADVIDEKTESIKSEIVNNSAQKMKEEEGLASVFACSSSDKDNDDKTVNAAMENKKQIASTPAQKVKEEEIIPTASDESLPPFPNDSPRNDNARRTKGVDDVKKPNRRRSRRSIVQNRWPDRYDDFEECSNNPASTPSVLESLPQIPSKNTVISSKSKRRKTVHFESIPLKVPTFSNSSVKEICQSHLYKGDKETVLEKNSSMDFDTEIIKQNGSTCDLVTLQITKEEKDGKKLKKRRRHSLGGFRLGGSVTEEDLKGLSRRFSTSRSSKLLTYNEDHNEQNDCVSIRPFSKSSIQGSTAPKNPFDNILQSPKPKTGCNNVVECDPPQTSGFSMNVTEDHDDDDNDVFFASKHMHVDKISDDLDATMVMHDDNDSQISDELSNESNKVMSNSGKEKSENNITRQLPVDNYYLRGEIELPSLSEVLEEIKCTFSEKALIEGSALARAFACWLCVTKKESNADKLLDCNLVSLLKSLVRAELVMITQDPQSLQRTPTAKKTLRFCNFDPSAITPAIDTDSDSIKYTERSIEAITKVLDVIGTFNDLKDTSSALLSVSRCCQFLKALGSRENNNFLQNICSKAMISSLNDTRQWRCNWRGLSKRYLSQFQELKSFLSCEFQSTNLIFTYWRKRLGELAASSIRYELRKFFNPIPVSYTKSRLDKKVHDPDYGGSRTKIHELVIMASPDGLNGSDTAIADGYIGSVVNLAFQRIYTFMKFVCNVNCLSAVKDQISNISYCKNEITQKGIGRDKLTEEDIDLVLDDLDLIHCVMSASGAFKFLHEIFEWPGVKEEIEGAGGWTSVERAACLFISYDLELYCPEERHFILLKDVKLLMKELKAQKAYVLEASRNSKKYRDEVFKNFKCGSKSKAVRKDVKLIKENLLKGRTECAFPTLKERESDGSFCNDA